jgi:hypothetical protein
MAPHGNSQVKYSPKARLNVKDITNNFNKEDQAMADTS